MKKRKIKKFISAFLSFALLVSFSMIVTAENTNSEKFSYPFEDTENFVLISWDYGNGHTGINITSYHSHPIYQASIKSVCDGTVVYALDNHETAGNYIVIETEDNIRVSYMMMDKPTTLKVGDKVEKGKTIIGYVGKSGNATGANLLLSFFKASGTNDFWATASNSIDPKEFFSDIKFKFLS